MMQREDVHVVQRREPLDEPENRRNDALAAGSIDTAGHDQANAHGRSV